ncbi:TdeIII family type II restriction endonuclease [Candidatus Acidulodesulfobacterium sp. H_13]|uniref:TdeIII family type II restriction endonuclease n=1 Tax=Candidatus Acidulodesulfobacterium sp. H_13 TaxID=3395470 RepID=UPI003AF6FC51
MALSKQQIQSVEDTIRNSLRNKFKTYNPEPAVMPFHARLLGKDRLALYSFIHSLNTNFGTTIFEPVAVSLASSRFKVAKLQMKSGTQISEKAQYEIQRIVDELTAANKKPDKQKEIEIIRKVCQKGEMRTVKPARVDVYLESNNDEIYLFDIKTAKPNKGGFKEFKRTLLEWVATVLSENPNAKINTLIAIPYNPYEPKPYSRWTMAGMLDLEQELKVAEEFWDFLGGKGTYDDLLGCFERVGIELRDEIDDYFKRFKNE